MNSNLSCSPVKPILSIITNRALIYSLTKREVFGRYKGSIGGIFWSFINPIFMLTVYTFFFRVVFKARWSEGEGDGSNAEFAVIAFIGLIFLNMFAECINRSPLLIVGNPSYVTKIVFPLEILPIVTMGAALFHSIVSYCVWYLFYILNYGAPLITGLQLPLVFLPLILVTLGISWALASLGIYLRDIAQFTSIVTGSLVFLSPIFFPLSAMPENLQDILKLNPLTPAIEQARGVLIYGQGIEILSYGKQLGTSCLIAWLGFSWFQKTRSGFADVL